MLDLFAAMPDNGNDDKFMVTHYDVFHCHVMSG